VAELIIAFSYRSVTAIGRAQKENSYKTVTCVF